VKQLVGKFMCFMLSILDIFVKIILGNKEKYKMYNSVRDVK
jgi:hypothetical protein|tara:strand:- start:282 stop:404 length:123 start_codon:yes stop_codon:yes gene_type:complete